MSFETSLPIKRPRTYDGVAPFWPEGLAQMFVIVLRGSSDDTRVVYGIDSARENGLVFQIELRETQAYLLLVALQAGGKAASGVVEEASDNVAGDPDLRNVAAAAAATPTVVVIPSTPPGDGGPKASAIKFASQLNEAHLARASG